MVGAGHDGEFTDTKELRIMKYKEATKIRIKMNGTKQ